MKKPSKMALGATAVAALAIIGGGIALALPAQAQDLVGANVIQGVEDGTDDGETADDAGK